MTDDGILIIEDVQSIHWIKQLCEDVPEDLNKNKYNDIVFTIDKLNYENIKFKSLFILFISFSLLSNSNIDGFFENIL